MIILTMLSGSSTTDGEEDGDADEIDGVGETSLPKLQSNIDAPFSEDGDNAPVYKVPAGDEDGYC